MEFVETIVTSSVKHNFIVHVIETSHIKDLRNSWHKYFTRDGISTETSAKSLPRNVKMCFHIASFYYFSFSAENCKGVVVSKKYIGGLVINTFALLLSAVSTIKFPVEVVITNRKVPISARKECF